jgi:hypothetical protein
MTDDLQELIGDPEKERMLIQYEEDTWQEGNINIKSMSAESPTAI